MCLILSTVGGGSDSSPMSQTTMQELSEMPESEGSLILLHRAKINALVSSSHPTSSLTVKGSNNPLCTLLLQSHPSKRGTKKKLLHFQALIFLSASRQKHFIIARPLPYDCTSFSFWPMSSALLLHSFPSISVVLHFSIADLTRV